MRFFQRMSGLTAFVALPALLGAGASTAEAANGLLSPYGWGCSELEWVRARVRLARL